MRARWLVGLGAAALILSSLGGAASAAPPKKCPKGKVTRVANGTRACLPAARYRARPKPPTPAAALLRSSLGRAVPGLRPRAGGTVPRAIPARLVTQLNRRLPAVEADLAAEVRAARALASNAWSDEVALSGKSVTTNADGSVTGRVTLTASGAGASVDVAVALTGRPSGALDIGLDITGATASGSRLTTGFTLRDVLGGATPKCPTGSGPIRVTGGVDATGRTEERFGGGRVKLGTVREATSPKITSSARAVIAPDGSLQPIAFTVSASLDYSRSAQVLAFLQSRSRAVATGTMTGTVDPATGKISGARIQSNVRTSGFGADQAAADAQFRAVLEQSMSEEVARLREKLVKAAKECGARYEVTLALTTDAEFATHSASGTLNSTLVAVPGGTGGGFTATGPLGYGDLRFTSKIGECSYSNPVSVAATWTVTVERTSTDRLRVTWDTAATGPKATATISCPGGSVPGQPGPILLQPAPTTFELPEAGGQQAIGGGFQDGGDGFVNTGTMTVTPRSG